MNVLFCTTLVIDHRTIQTLNKILVLFYDRFISKRSKQPSTSFTISDNMAANIIMKRNSRHLSKAWQTGLHATFFRKTFIVITFCKICKITIFIVQVTLSNKIFKSWTMEKSNSLHHTGLEIICSKYCMEIIANFFRILSFSSLLQISTILHIHK